MQLSKEPLISAEAIQKRTADLAKSISKDLDGHEVTAVVVLKGALPFAADLIRHLSIPVRLEFIRVKSYAGTTSTGNAMLLHKPEEPLEDKHLLVVEDILDTGRTAAAIMDYLRAQRPARLVLCTLLDKPTRREVEIESDYTGFTIDNHFVVGYGLDYEEEYRNLPHISILEQ